MYVTAMVNSQYHAMKSSFRELVEALLVQARDDLPQKAVVEDTPTTVRSQTPEVQVHR